MYVVNTRDMCSQWYMYLGLYTYMYMYAVCVKVQCCFRESVVCFKEGSKEEARINFNSLSLSLSLFLSLQLMSPSTPFHLPFALSMAKPSPSPVTINPIPSTCGGIPLLAKSPSPLATKQVATSRYK